MEPQPAPTNSGAVIEAVERLSKAEIQRLPIPGHAASIELLVLPKGKEAVSIKRFVDEWATRPDRRRGTARLTTLASFIEHVNRFKDAQSAVFADVTGGTP